MVSRDDFEIGDEPVEVERKPRGGVVISVRLSAEEADRFQEIAEQGHLTVSQVVRQALGAYLRQESERLPAFAAWSSTIVGDNCKLEVSWRNPGRSNLYTRGNVIDAGVA